MYAWSVHPELIGAIVGLIAESLSMLSELQTEIGGLTARQSHCVVLLHPSLVVRRFKVNGESVRNLTELGLGRRG